MANLASLLLAAAPLHAQCPPSPTPDPVTGIIEGRVTAFTQGSLNSSCAVDSQNRFAVVYETPRVLISPFVFDHDVLIQRFEADGTCICAPGDECPEAVKRSGPRPRSQNTVGWGIWRVIERLVVVG